MSPTLAVAPRFTPSHKRAVGIVRVSEVAGREGDSFRSPDDQNKIIGRTCEVNDFRLIATFTELDVSAYTRNLDRRPGLGPAIAMIEAGEADVIVGPYFDRLFRNIQYQLAALKRIEAAGGSVLAADFGEVRTDTASRWLTSSMLGLIAEYLARLTGEKTEEAKVRAIAAGIPTFDHIPFGYRKDEETRRLVIVEKQAEVVRQAFRLRESGATLEAVRDYLRANGARPRIGIRGVQNLLKQRMYLGELRFGKLINLRSHEPIVDPGLFRAVQGMRITRNARRTPSKLLLARLGVAKCASCDQALIAGGQTHISRRTGEPVRYDDYRCSSMGDCKERVHISASVLDEAVVRYLKAMDVEGHADADDELEAAERAYQQAEDALSAIVALLDGLGDLSATQKKLADLKARREDAFEHWQSLRAVRGTAGVRASNWDDLTVGERRALIRSRIKSVIVTRGASGSHTPDRISIKPFTE